ncbi:hypothetical protein [Undibacterium fentianense]|uniref:Uncharacterized protein n=1 Tax=Undibacterium fentianense TaxID=2828728 RepID=A0A941E095_9BURK|nr:hypothetical protein [Undibacterium fentianense]MBR7798642.1 hypothetical protein [Undibacterium fentianense]
MNRSLPATQTIARIVMSLCVFALSASSVTANAAEGAASPKKSSIAGKAKSSKHAKADAKASEIDNIEPEPSIEQSDDTEYKCELGNSLVMYAHPEDNQSIAMRWKNRLYKLTRVETSTGAHRYENQKVGLLWINIPSKGMLLDSRRGHQLANECKSTKVASLGTTETQVK